MSSRNTVTRSRDCPWENCEALTPSILLVILIAVGIWLFVREYSFGYLFLTALFGSFIFNQICVKEKGIQTNSRIRPINRRRANEPPRFVTARSRQQNVSPVTTGPPNLFLINVPPWSNNNNSSSPSPGQDVASTETRRSQQMTGSSDPLIRSEPFRSRSNLAAAENMGYDDSWTVTFPPNVAGVHRNVSPVRNHESPPPSYESVVRINPNDGLQEVRL